MMYKENRAFDKDFSNKSEALLSLLTHSYNLNAYASRCLEHFFRICAIPHGSFHTEAMFAYLCESLTSLGYEIKTDKAKNIYAKKCTANATPRVCLQAHYDMVCVGDAAQNMPIIPFERDGRLYGNNSSLGADNGIGMACMLALECEGIELLFTNDEEVGMLGANALELGIQAPLLLNLDSEDLGEIVLGCAGGIDINLTLPFNHSSYTSESTHTSLHSTPLSLEAALISHPYAYKISSKGFLGGHSGIEIDKNKENVIREFAFFALSHDMYILSLQAGEKRNSIPTGLKALILSHKPLPLSCATPKGASFECVELDSETLNNELNLLESKGLEVLDSSFSESRLLEANTALVEKSYLPKPIHQSLILPLLLGIHNGVYATSSEGVLESLNLSLLEINAQGMYLMMMARGNNDVFLHRIAKQIECVAKGINPLVEVRSEGFYSAWEKDKDLESSPYLEILKECYAKEGVGVKLAQIHAGLECGILKARLLAHHAPSNLQILSIGPTIHTPHSINECLELKSFKQFCAILESFVARVGKA